ncbi:MAG: hypothetical protein AAGI07_17305, partial [Bacteroidota bacterium]
WWERELKVNKKSFLVHFAWGYGSQHIFIIKEISLMIVCTGKNYGIDFYEGPLKLLEKEILPLIENIFF